MLEVERIRRRIDELGLTARFVSMRAFGNPDSVRSILRGGQQDVKRANALRDEGVSAPFLAFALWVAASGPVRVIDGDTFDAGGVRYRVAGLDAPETHGGCAESRAKAAAATRELRRLLTSGPVLIERVDLQPATRRYRERVIARVRVGGRDVRGAMIAAGVARAWPASRPWCART